MHTDRRNTKRLAGGESQKEQVCLGVGVLQDRPSSASGPGSEPDGWRVTTERAWRSVVTAIETAVVSERAAEAIIQSAPWKCNERQKQETAVAHSVVARMRQKCIVEDGLTRVKARA